MLYKKLTPYLFLASVFGLLVLGYIYMEGTITGNAAGEQVQTISVEMTDLNQRFYASETSLASDILENSGFEMTMNEIEFRIQQGLIKINARQTHHSQVLAMLFFCLIFGSILEIS